VPGSSAAQASSCTVGTLTALNEPFDKRRLIDAQPRYRAKAEPAQLEPLDDGRIHLKFQRPQRAIAPGQICALYDGGRLLGGGVFESVG